MFRIKSQANDKKHDRFLKAMKAEGMKEAIDFSGSQRKDNAVKTTRMQSANGYQPSLTEFEHNR